MDEITTERWQDPEAPGRQTLKVSGSATIGQALGVRDALLEALEAANELQADVSALTAADLTCLQLLCAAHQSAEKAEKRIQIVDGGNEIFKQVVTDAGFQRHVGCSCDNTSSCIWVGGEN
jgi:ABC-type transporter Mla MlaB component